MSLVFSNSQITCISSLSLSLSSSSSRFQGPRPRTCSGLHITIQKSLNWPSCVPFCCWLIFHNSVWESGTVHSTNMLYPFIVIVVDLYQKLMCLKFFQNIWFLLWWNSGNFAVFLKNVIFSYVILDISSSFSVQVSVLYSRVCAVYLVSKFQCCIVGCVLFI
jgi:hypothetical protein